MKWTNILFDQRYESFNNLEALKNKVGQKQVIKTHYAVKYKLMETIFLLFLYQ